MRLARAVAVVRARWIGKCEASAEGAGGGNMWYSSGLLHGLAQETESAFVVEKLHGGCWSAEL